MTEIKRIHGAGGGGGGGGNQTTYVTQNVSVETPVVRPTYTPDDPGLRSTSFAQMQFLLCEGEIEGPVGGNTVEGLERSVYLDNTPIRVGTSDPTPQPNDLVLSYGRPSPQQTGVPGFNRVSSVVGVDTEVRFNLPVAQTVTASDYTASWYGRVILTFEGLFESRSTEADPGVYATNVSLRIEYEDSLNVIREVFDGSLNGKFSGAFQREFEFQYQGQGPWTVRAIRQTADDQDRSTGERTYRSTFNFSTVVLSLDQKLIYPYSSVLSLGIRADQYSSLPQVSVDLKGLIIDVPSNYDPETRVYTGLWDGTFQQAYSDNPAWILRDIVVNDRYGLGQYIDADQLDRWTLYTIAQYCDQLVPGPNGVDEPRFTCNVVLQTSEQAWTVLQQLSSIFRGLLYYASGTIVSIQDRPKTPVFTFNESNTIEVVDNSGKVSQGNFIYAGTAQRARHTAVLASWDDPANNYQPRVEYIADEQGIARFGYRAMDLRLIGVTSRGQALRAANWALISESLLTDSVTFSTNEIGSAVRPGDVIKIADPTKAARRYGGRISAVNPAGTIVTLDDSPTEPAGGWGGTTFSYMTVDAEGEPVLTTRQIASMNGDTINLVEDAGVPDPVATFPWLLESPDLTAQLFQVLTVEEQEEGVYAFTALRYREDIYDTVDFDTPLNENEDYLFTPVNPLPPTIDVAQIIWDNNQAKIDAQWTPPDTNTVLNGFDLTVREYRLQYQAGSLQEDGVTIVYDDVWREVERQGDNREQIPINQFVATDRFRIRLCSVSRLGVESDWIEATCDDLTVWFPMPDISDTANATLSHLNQSSGSQLFTWRVTAPVPPYVNGIRLWGKPRAPLNATEAAGLNPPDADGWYVIGDKALDDYYAIAFHSLQTWDVRFNLITAVPGIVGESYALDEVDRLEIEPPVPVNFRVVWEGGAQSRVGQKRFSWELPANPPFIQNWPLGRVNDITLFSVRYRQGTTPDWDNSFSLFSDGIPGDQTWFETNLFDYGQWCVMLKATDATGWQSEDTAVVTVNVGDPLPTNVVDRIDIRDLDFPGDLVNFDKFGVDPGIIYPEPLTDAMYQPPTDDEFYEGISGFLLRQTDPTLVSSYTATINVAYNEAQIVIYTSANATYRWFLRRLSTGTELMYPAPLTDPFYQRDQSELITTDQLENVSTDNGNLILAEFLGGLDSLMYADPPEGGSEGWHPYAPNEVLLTGTYEARLDMVSLDGTVKGEVTDVDFVLDYPDVNWQAEDVSVAAGGTRITFPSQTFRHLKAVSMNVQDNSFAPGAPVTAVIEFKSDDYIDVRTLDASGTPVAGVVDVFAVGY